MHILIENVEQIIDYNSGFNSPLIEAVHITPDKSEYHFLVRMPGKDKQALKLQRYSDSNNEFDLELIDMATGNVEYSRKLSETQIRSMRLFYSQIWQTLTATRRQI
jgi:hypothetical protein